jgi:endonuclease/exonuclease/phosphatase family metal-dependent hydrolase
VVDEDIAVTLTASVGDASYDSATTTVTVVNIDATPAPLTAEGYTQNFATFAAATPDLPLGWTGRGLVTAFNADASNQVWGQGFGSGYRGGASVFGYQHTGSTSTTASPNFDKVLTLRNDTGSTISDLTVAYTGRAERLTDSAATRFPAYTVTVAGSTVEALAYSTGDGDGGSRSVSLSGLSVAAGETFQIVWSSNRGGGSGSSRQIGLSDVSVTLGSVQTVPTVSGLSVPTVTLGRESAEAIATIASDGGATLSAAGFVVIATDDLTGELTLATAGAVNVPEAAAFVGQISETLSGLTAGTGYTIRAYATNSLGTAYSAAQSFTTLSAPASFAGLYTQDFATYQGLLPVGWSAGTSNETNGYLGEWGSGSSAGFLGVGSTETTGVLGYQHTTTSGQLTVTLTLVNDTGAEITELDVGYVGRVARPTQTRTPEWTVSVAGSTVAELGYSTGNTAGEGGTAIDQAVSTSLTGLSIAAGAEFTITWTSINEAGAGGQSGSSRQIGIADVSVALPGVAVPSIGVTGSLAAFTTVSGTPSAAGSVVVTGADLLGDITATAPAGFEVSGDGVAFAATATFPASTGTVLGTLYVRVAAAAAAGSLSGNVQLTSPSATRVDVPVSASVAAAPLSLPYGPENFETGFETSIAPWFTYNAAGNRNWSVVTSTLGGGSNRTFQINGFGGDVPANDWLLLGQFDFSNATNPAISFSTLNDFTTNGTVVNELTLKVSTDYAGAGDPSLATWTEIPFTKPAAEEVKTASLQVPLTETAGEPSVYVAFHYVAGGTASGETALWQVDDVTVADVTSPALAITTAASLTELDYDVVGTISIPVALATDLVVTLTSSDSGELLVYSADSSPAASTVVTILAGQTSGQFFMEGVPDGEVDGNIAVTLTATATGYTAAETTVTVVNLDLPGADLTADGYTQDFTSFTSAETLPLGWSLTATNSTYTAWAATDTGAKFGSATVDVFGYQHTGSTGVVQQVLTLVNATGSTIADLTVAYDGRVARATEGRTPSYSVFVGGSVVPGLVYSTADGDDVRKQASITGLAIGAGEKFSIVWESDGSTTGSPGSGSRRQIGIGDVSVTLGVSDTTPSIGNLAVPSATLGRDSAGATATISADGGATITAAGFVFIATADLTGELTLATAGATIVAVDSPAVGEIAGTLSGLVAETGYTVRAYATNAQGTAYTGPLPFTTISSAVSLSDLYTQDFATFTGTLPDGWSVASTGDVLTYGGAWGSGTSGGLRGAGESTGGVIGYQHTSSTGTFTVTVAMVNDTGATIESLDVSYLGRVARADQTRIPEWTVSIDGVTAASLAYSTNNTAGQAGAAGDQTISATVTGLAIGVGEIFTISWASDRGEAAGSSRQIGIGAVSVSAGGSQPATPTITPSGVPTTDSLRIVTYNIAASQGSGQPRSGLDTILAAISSETFAGRTDRIDVLALQEVQSQTTTTAAVVSLLNGLYGAGTYARGTLNGSGLYTVGVVYDTASLTLVEEVAITTGGPRQTIRYRFEPAAGSAADGFYLYNSHLKAEADSTSEATRAAEAAAIRANADALGNGVSVLYVGDFNLYTSNEVAFQTFVGAGNGQAFDPISSPGNWSGSSGFRGIFTQAPSATGSGELVGGGLDDRFDFQLVSGEVLDGTGFDYLANSYRAFGNNGSVPVNGSINSGSNTALAGLSNRLQVLDLLTTVSDHLPVVADYTMPTSQGLTALSTTAGTASTASSFVVSAADLTGDLAISAPSGFELSLAENSGYTAAGLVLSPVSGAVAATTIYIRLAATATAGSYTGDVSFASTGAQTQTLAIPTSTVTAPPPPVKVTGVYVRGSAWNANYLARSPFTTVSGAALGWQLPDGSAQLTNASNVGWNNVDRISVRFDQAIAQPTADALQLVLGTAEGNQTIVPTAAPTLLAGGTVAQWTLPVSFTRLVSGRYVISIASAGITNAAGTAALDGEWTSSTSTFATGSGNGTAGGTFNFFFNALVGDVGGNGTTNTSDISAIRNKLKSALNTLLESDADYRLDLNGSNNLNSTDLSQLRTEMPTALGRTLASLPSVTAPVEQSVRSTRGFASLAEESGTISQDTLSDEAWAWYALSVEGENSKKT